MITGKSGIYTGQTYVCSWVFIFCLNRTTNEDGRCPGLITKQIFTSGVYKICFDTAQYWESIGETCFYPYVEVSKDLKCYVLTW